MKTILTLLSILFIHSFSYSQNTELRLIEKGDFSKTEKNLAKSLDKNPESVEANYVMAILLIQREYEKYNPEQAYHFLRVAEKAFEKVTEEKEFKRLFKIPVTAPVLEKTLETICLNALEDCGKVNDISTYRHFVAYYEFAPVQLKETATTKINLLAYQEACVGNTVQSYQDFIDAYPDAKQITEARSKRNLLAFQDVRKADHISDYKKFISLYPDATEIKQAWSRVHEIAFEEAKKINSADAYKKFVTEYPDCQQYAEAFRLLESRQFLENTFPGDWYSYARFIRDYPDNTYKDVAQDTIYTVGKNMRDWTILQYCADHFEGNMKNKALLLFHDLFTDDGEKATLDLFYEHYDNDIFRQIKISDYEIAAAGDRLELEKAYDSKKQPQYDEYIRLAAPNEKAFLALQRMIAVDIATKNWPSAVAKVKEYRKFFGDNDKKIERLLVTLEAPDDRSVKINSVGTGVNTVKGGEYAPVISADDKLLYFCGRDRKDNIGGEDIFVSSKVNGRWGQAKLVTALSESSSNDAPLNISVDGTTMLLFKSGKLYFSEKMSFGWGNSIVFPEQINSGEWQADAMIAGDGRALIFAAVRSGGYNLYEKINFYHGGTQYPSDIYVSLRDENEEWGEPVNMGHVINTPYCDRMPFLHPDMKTLYFSSDGHNGLGGLDVYKSTRLADSCWTCWSEPVNMGKEINTEDMDWGYRISTDGDKAYFSKGDRNSNTDIFWLNLPKHLRPDLVATISGRLVDKDNLPVSAEIRWEDLETGRKIGQSKSDPTDGSFFLVLPLGKIYGYYVDKDEYFPLSNNIDLRKNEESVQIEEKINMISFKQMIEEGTAVSVNNLFFNFAKSSLLPYSRPELVRVAAIIKTNSLNVEISGHTDNIGDDEKNQELSELRAKAVKDFLVSEGCSPDQLLTVGYGATKPVASNDTEVGRAKNRRVELRFISK